MPEDLTPLVTEHRKLIRQRDLLLTWLLTYVDSSTIQSRLDALDNEEE